MSYQITHLHASVTLLIHWNVCRSPYQTKTKAIPSHTESNVHDFFGTNNFQLNVHTNRFIEYVLRICINTRCDGPISHCLHSGVIIAASANIITVFFVNESHLHFNEFGSLNAMYILLERWQDVLEIVHELMQFIDLLILSLSALSRFA